MELPDSAHTELKRRARIEELEMDMNRLMQAHTLAKSERDKLEREPRRIHNSLVMINCLPDEILGGIFLLLLHSYSNPNSNKSRRPSPRLIKWVWSTCYLWREISIATPGLWVHISWNSRHKSSPLPLAEISLQRSGVLPIDMYLHFYDEMNAKRRKSLAEFLLIAKDRRCNSLKISAEWVPQFDSLLPFPENIMKARHLEFNEVNDTISEAMGSFETSLKFQPFSLALAFDASRPSLLESVDTSQLQHLVLSTHIAVPDLRELLRNCHSLRTLNMKGLAGPVQNDDAPALLNDLDFPLLNTACVPGLFLSVFSSWLLPSLHSLTISHGNGEGSYDTAAPDLRFPCLRFLYIEHSSACELYNLPALSRMNPQIETLHLSVANIYETVMICGGMLFRGSEENKLLPALRLLRLATEMWRRLDAPWLYDAMEPVLRDLLSARPCLAVELMVHAGQADALVERLSTDFDGRFRLLALPP